MGEEEDLIEQAVEARRERLRALRTAQELLSTPDDNNSSAQNNANGLDHDNDNTNNDVDAGDENQQDNPSMKFRNYVPHDKQLQEGKVAPPMLPKFEDPVAVTPLEEENKDPFVNIAPKKPNWDLRRDVQKKLDKLERRTQKALYKLMEEQEREKQMAEEGGGNEA